MVPFTALLDELLYKAQSKGIQAHKWTFREVPSKAQLIFVSLEASIRAEFLLYVLIFIKPLILLSKLNINYRFLRSKEHLIKHMVFDECHHFLTSQGFHHKFQDCSKFAQFKFQKIYLTATLPSKLEDHLLTACGLSRTLTRIIRARTYNSLISYHILQVKTDIIINSSVQLAQQLQTL